MTKVKSMDFPSSAIKQNKPNKNRFIKQLEIQLQADLEMYKHKKKEFDELEQKIKECNDVLDKLK